MAGVAGKAPYVESRDLACVLQGPHGGEVDPLRRHGSRGTVLRMDRQPGETSRRRPVCAQADAPQATSKWSDLNRKRWAELEAAGLLTSAGLVGGANDNTYAPRPVIPDLPAYIAKALKTNAKAWEFFRKLAPTYRRDFVVWIHTAKRPETRERRIRESIRLLAAGKKLGLK